MKDAEENENSPIPKDQEFRKLIQEFIDLKVQQSHNKQ